METNEVKLMKVTELREKQKLSREQLAITLGVSHITIVLQIH